jgi:hypothetical protein
LISIQPIVISIKKTLTEKQKEMLMAGDVAYVEVVDELN